MRYFHLFQTYLSIRTCHAHFERNIVPPPFTFKLADGWSSRGEARLSERRFYFLFIALQLIESFS